MAAEYRYTGDMLEPGGGDDGEHMVTLGLNWSGFATHEDADDFASFVAARLPAYLRAIDRTATKHGYQNVEES